MQKQILLVTLKLGIVGCCSARQVSHERAPLLDSALTASEAITGHRRPYSGFEQQWQQCGTWQDRYQGLHGDILAGKAAQMYLVAEAPSGLADTLACIGTLLYVSLLTDRAFLIRDTGGLNSILTYGYEQSHIKWGAKPEALEILPRVRVDDLRTSGQEPTGDETDRLRCLHHAWP